MDHWVYVEVGGSSVQSCVRRHGVFRFSAGVTREPDVRYALAVPGVIRPPEVWYASNLGWPEVADPARELGLDEVNILVNDAVAAGLGESALRAGDAGTLPDLLYLGLGTGVGTALVRQGRACDADMGHLPVGGPFHCEGCRARGCLNSTIEAKRLSAPVTGGEADFVAEMVTTALARTRRRVQLPSLLVIGGGIAATNPGVVDRLAATTDMAVEPTAAAVEAKSAAYAGLHHLASRHGAAPD